MKLPLLIALLAFGLSSCVHKIAVNMPSTSIELHSCTGCRAEQYWIDGQEKIFVVVSRPSDLQKAQAELCEARKALCVQAWVGNAAILERHQKEK